MLFDRSVYALYIELVVLPAMAGVAAFSLQTRATLFHELFGLDASQPDTLNAALLCVFSVLSCWVVAAGPWTDDSKPTAQAASSKPATLTTAPAPSTPRRSGLWQMSAVTDDGMMHVQGRAAHARQCRAS